MFDRESGKPKGFGFCEYKDQETALSAMRNLNGYEIGGRALRVDNACTEKSRMEMQQLLQGPQVENPYGDHCESDDAPEIITKTVASLPPEQMYELMKQMNLCIQNNPSEARQMLQLNPQLAYALLQVMVVMRIVDPTAALNMLYKSNQMPPILTNNSSGGAGAVGGQGSGNSNVNVNHLQQSTSSSTHHSLNMGMNVIGPSHSNQFNQLPTNDMDLRAMSSMNMPPMDPRLARGMDTDMRSVGPMPNPVPPPQLMDPRGAQRAGGPMMSQMSSSQNNNPSSVGFPSDPRQRPMDPRLRGGPQLGGPPPPVAPPSSSSSSSSLMSGSIMGQLQSQSSAQQQLHNRLATNCGLPNDASDQEKAALIMQVLQLTDEQIAQLPPEQRASILVLKEQIAKSTQR